MSDPAAIMAFLLEGLAELLEANPRSWGIVIGDSHIEPRDGAIYVDRVLTERNFDLADPDCHKNIKNYLLEHEDYVVFNFDSGEYQPWSGAIDRAKLNDILSWDGGDWEDKLDRIRFAAKATTLEGDYYLDEDPENWDEFLKDYSA